MGTPHRVCRTFARFDFILVPLPAARITAKIGELSDMYPHHSYRSSARRSRTIRSSAGAAGFEPAIPGPKPGALPLGHAPVQARADYTGAPFRRQNKSHSRNVGGWDLIRTERPYSYPAHTISTPQETGSQTPTERPS